MTVTVVQASAVDLGEAPQPLRVQQFRRPLQLGEVLLDAGVGELGQHLGTEALDRGSKFAHGTHLFMSNMGSILVEGGCRRCDAHHVAREVLGVAVLGSGFRVDALRSSW
jgi:hypothetical protein